MGHVQVNPNGDHDHEKATDSAVAPAGIMSGCRHSVSMRLQPNAANPKPATTTAATVTNATETRTSARVRRRATSGDIPLPCPPWAKIPNWLVQSERYRR